MKDEFFEKILNAVEDRPFITAIARNGEEFETIAQISEGDGGQLRVTSQSDSTSVRRPRRKSSIHRQ